MTVSHGKKERSSWLQVCSEDTARIKAEPEDQDYYGDMARWGVKASGLLKLAIPSCSAKGMGSRSARHTLIAVTGLVFCTLSPLITVLCFINGSLDQSKLSEQRLSSATACLLIDCAASLHDILQGGFQNLIC